MNLLTRYKNGNVRVSLFDDGTKIRETFGDEFEPEYPENCDMTIRTVCNNRCDYCYMNCSIAGDYADFRKYDFLNHMFPGMELAINMNFPPHPRLYNFLKQMKDQGVYVNATVNENHFMHPINRKWIKSLVDEHLLWGIGISYTGKSDNDEFIKAVREFSTAIIHTIAGIFNIKTLHDLGCHDLKILILGYKNIGRGKDYLADNPEILEGIDWLAEELPYLVDKFKLISFDNLALEQLRVKEWVDSETWKERYQGDEGSQTFYIDLVHGTFARDSLTDKTFPIDGKSLKQMFNYIRFDTTV